MRAKTSFQCMFTPLGLVDDLGFTEYVCIITNIRGFVKFLFVLFTIQKTQKVVEDTEF